MALRATGEQVLIEIWSGLAQSYFPEVKHLTEYTVLWSRRRQKRVLGACCVRKRQVTLAQELEPTEHRRWLEAVIFHEMCHAVLEEGVERRKGRRCWHGPSFKALEARHPDSGELRVWMKSGGWAAAVRSHRAKNRRSRARVG
ncbi:MAG: SprT-like domain-containing protein [Oligoflexia bacterium]|nr:SprT-like domain-containing protein [Oligoflexia bacterium]